MMNANIPFVQNAPEPHPYIAAELEQHSVWLENEVERMEELAFEGATFSPQVLASLARSHNAIARLLEDVK